MGIASQSIPPSTTPRTRLNDLIARPLPLFLGIFFVFLIVFGASIVLLPKRYGQLIVGDGIYYYVYLRSLAFDGDLEFTNDYTIYQQSNTEDLNKKYEMLVRKTPTGMAGNTFSVGPALLWSPAFLASHLLASLLGQTGDGYSYWYEAPVLFLSIGYGFLGILLMYRVAAGMFSAFAAFVSILGIWLATNVVYYMGVSPSASHVLTLFTSALFVYLWWRGRQARTRVGWFVWGLSGGLMALVRWQDTLIILLAVLEWFVVLRRERSANKPGALTSQFLNGLVFVGALLLAFIPQMLVWNVLYGSPLTVPQGDGFLLYLRPEIWNVWFSTKRGLFTWSPILVAAVIGFVPLYLKNKTLGAAAILIFLAETYVNSIVTDWWGGEAFGARRFISLMPFFALGLAAFIDWIRPRVPQAAILAALVILIVWNNLFLLQYNLWLHGIGEISPVPTFQEMTIDKFTAPFLALEKFRNR